MDSVFYRQLTALSRRLNQVEAPQLSFLSLKNFIFNRQIGSLRKRGGSVKHSVTGDIWAIEGYNKDTANPKTPIAVIPIRHRRDGSTSYIEKFDWSAGTWSAITQGSKTSFNVANVGSACQIDDLMALFCGRPAMIKDIDSGDIERLGGPAPTSAPTVATGAAGALTGTYRYVYTFYDSASGWESSPSPISAEVNPSSDTIDVTGLPTTADRENVTDKRIYRTQSTNEEPFFLSGTVTLATTSYNDNVTDANLTTQAPSDGDHDEAPDGVYVGEKWANRIFLAKDNELWHSHDYDGALARLEYFSTDRRDVFDHRITGLVASPQHGGLLIFKPPGMGIDILSGRNEAEFNIQPFLPQEGTNWHKSVAVKDNLLTYWGQVRPRLVVGNDLKEDYDADLDLLLREYSTHDYSQDMFIWSFWSHIDRQFVYGFGAVDVDGQLWKEESTGLSAKWIDSQTGEEIDWLE